MYLEYNWTFDVYQPRLGDVFTSIDGFRSFDTLDDAKAVLARLGLRLGKKTDSRTWPIEAASPRRNAWADIDNGGH